MIRASFPASTPEDAFLENNPTISPIDMIECMIDRTTAVVRSLDKAMVCEHPGISKKDICSVLWQVEGNLVEIKKVANAWHMANPSTSKECVVGRER